MNDLSLKKISFIPLRLILRCSVLFPQSRKALKAGLAGKGVLQSLGEMGVSRREALGGQMDSRGRLVGATAPVLCSIDICI